jgi:hypothetical protein
LPGAWTDATLLHEVEAVSSLACHGVREEIGMVHVRTRTGVKSFWFGSLLLLVVGGAFSLIGAWLLSSNLGLVRSGASARATVVDMVKHTSSKSTTYNVVIEYETATGERIRSESPVGSNSKAYRAGDAVEIFYSRSDPRTFVFDRFSDKYGFPSIFLLAGVLCLLVDAFQVGKRVLLSSRSNTPGAGPSVNPGT